MDKKLLFLVLVFFLVLGGFATQVLYQSNVRKVRAANPLPPVAEKSFILAFPQGMSCKISVVVRDENEATLKDIPVQITSTLGSPAQANGTTSDSGIADFVITSETTGISQITAQATDPKSNNTIIIPTQVTCEFK